MRAFVVIPLLLAVTFPFGLAFIAAPIAHAQPSAANDTPCTGDKPLPDFAAGLTYDVASIRPHYPDGRMTIGNPPKAARFDITGVSMRNLVGLAYGVQSRETTGGPEWISSQSFDLHARSDDSTSAILERLTNCEAGLAKMLMLRTLLVERTKLVVHRVAREDQGYNLVIAKGGPKLKESPPIPADDISPGAAVGGSMSIRPVRLGDRSGDQMEVHRHTMQQVAVRLSGQTGVPVTDKTGLTQTYDFSIQYCPPRRQASDDNSDEPSCPQLVDVIQEQLGLRLEPTKATIQGVVIDHIERPSEN